MRRRALPRPAPRRPRLQPARGRFGRLGLEELGAPFDHVGDELTAATQMPQDVGLALGAGEHPRMAARHPHDVDAGEVREFAGGVGADDPVEAAPHREDGDAARHDPLDFGAQVHGHEHRPHREGAPHGAKVAARRRATGPGPWRRAVAPPAGRACPGWQPPEGPPPPPCRAARGRATTRSRRAGASSPAWRRRRGRRFRAPARDGRPRIARRRPRPWSARATRRVRPPRGRAGGRRRRRSPRW